MHPKHKEVPFPALYWLKRANLAVWKAMEDALGQHDITAPQMMVLGAVSENDGIEHRTLAEWMGVTSPTLTSIVDGLKERGYIERRQSPEDARVKQLHLTQQGRQLQAQVRSGQEEFMRRLLAGMSPGELVILAELLERLTHNAGDVQDCKPFNS